ncbi:WecB/TagA/CpsF family glycosyltransferase [Pseudanabaena sp. PCC 6802]|uniref:WecB/TagA/CpsF family glycosyltransferase n=1 Tax=Pseudanabaena sp. PCC 6802 TaxID=118173 RepID=UPI0003461C60|nr:WecB/TagA/CpsF family glycosyltransferase [Pseudanabaena sp. PCC 6802]
MRSCLPIISTCVHTTSYADACDRIQSWIAARQSCYIVAANVHVVMTAYWDRAYQSILDRAALVTPDGMPLVWGLRLLGQSQQQRVYGPDLMLAWCDRAADLGLPIYLYGGSDRALALLETKLKQQFPKIAIAGSYAPPYIDLRDLDMTSPDLPTWLESDINCIRDSGAAVVFVGLGCPKQEYWMAKVQSHLNSVAIGVGAAFDFHSGQVSQAPRWMMKIGLEWLYRFSQEPGRLWRRYLINNPVFIILFIFQLLKRIITKNQ